MRSAPHGGSAPQLALPARSPYRRLRAATRAVAGLKSRRAKASLFREGKSRNRVVGVPLRGDAAQETPAALGYRMPAEWEPHEATWLAWPHERTDWPGKFAPIPWLYGDIVRRLARTEKVRILVENEPAERSARRVLVKSGADLNAVEFFRHRTNRSWTRDYCPIFVHNEAGRVNITNWIFNGWAKYGNWRDDNQ